MKVQSVYEIFLYRVSQNNSTPFNSALFCNWGGVYVLYAKTTSKIFSEAEKSNFWESALKNLVI